MPVAAESTMSEGQQLWQRLALFAGGSVAIAVILHFGLRLPGIPYNVRELFGGADSWGNLLMFATAALAFGTAGALAGTVAAGSRFPYVTLPVVVIPCCYVIFRLLDESVSDESIYDLIGKASLAKADPASSNWHDIGSMLLSLTGSRSVAMAVEYAVRFIALAGHIVLMIAIAFASYVAARRDADAGRRGLLGALMRRFLLYLLCGLPWLFLFKLIVVDYADTDNLTELIGDLGILLYPLLLLIAANAVAVTYLSRSSSVRDVGITIVLIVLSLPVGWLLFKYGLRDDVQKYGQVFSAPQFLLGGERTDRFPESILMLRWLALQFMAVFGLACGMRIAAPVLPVRASVSLKG